VRLSQGGKTIEQQVVLTLEGPVPARVWLPPPTPVKAPRATTEAASPPAASFAPAAPVPPSAPAPSGLSTVFE